MMDLFLTQHSFSLQKTYIDGLDWCGLLVYYLWCFYQLFGLSILTAPIHCRGPTGENTIYCYISPKLFHEEKNSSPSWMAWGWAHFQQIFIFGWTIPLRMITLVMQLYLHTDNILYATLTQYISVTFSWQTEALTLLSDSYRYLCTMFMLLFLTVCSCSSVTPHCRFGPSLMLILHFYLQDLNSNVFFPTWQ